MVKVNFDTLVCTLFVVAMSNIIICHVIEVGVADWRMLFLNFFNEVVKYWTLV